MNVVLVVNDGTESGTIHPHETIRHYRVLLHESGLSGTAALQQRLSLPYDLLFPA